MIDLMRKFFSVSREADDSGAEPGGSEEDCHHDVRVATCSLFLEMANIDDEFSEEERDHIVSILKTEYQLSDECATDLMEAAREELEQSVDLWRFASRINEYYSPEEKIQIIEMIWRIVYVDGTMDKHEDYLVHKVSKLLRVSHKQFINAKLKVLHGGYGRQE
jgi:uncharacterized tellurite resistance protein B-like protein